MENTVKNYFNTMSAMLIEYEDQTGEDLFDGKAEGDLSPREKEFVCSTFRSSTLWEDSF
ncbi:MAG: hypothetical protein IKF29_00365 [Oceanobacillus sp.]|nr:hypothetical protein [Oceanobacillus sp.]